MGEPPMKEKRESAARLLCSLFFVVCRLTDKNA